MRGGPDSASLIDRRGHKLTEGELLNAEGLAGRNIGQWGEGKQQAGLGGNRRSAIKGAGVEARPTLGFRRRNLEFFGRYSLPGRRKPGTVLDRLGQRLAKGERTIG
jgi:hypothetical protein